MEETTNNQNQNGEGQNNRWAWIITGVVVAAAVVAFYVWPQQGGEDVSTEKPAGEMAQEEVDTYTASLEAVSGSDEVADIEKDLNDTNLNDLDREVSGLESEVGAE